MPTQEPLITKILNHEISRLAAIIVAVYTFIMVVILPIQRMEMRLERIEQNELKHIEANVMEIQADHSALEPRLDKIEQSLVRIEEALKK